MLRVERLYGHSAVVNWLDADSLVLDLGASRGRFTGAVIDRFACRVVAVEPVGHLYRSLPARPGLRTEQLAIAARSGPVTIMVGESDETATIERAAGGSGRAAEQVQGMSLADVLTHVDAGHASLVKMDIEGAELDVLESVAPETLARLEQLTVEYHDFLVPAWRSRVVAVDRRLIELGFYRLRVSRDRSDMLYVNTALHPLSRLERLVLLLRYRYLWGAARVLRQRLGRPAA